MTEYEPYLIVKRLIKELKTMPQDARIVTLHYEDDGSKTVSELGNIEYCENHIDKKLEGRVVINVWTEM